MNSLKLATAAFLVLSIATPVSADPTYSLDNLTGHPYRYLPEFGHASQSPGSPKHFRPGYGYSIPGPGMSSLLSRPSNGYGFLQNNLFGEATDLPIRPFGLSPWHLPGEFSTPLQAWPQF